MSKQTILIVDDEGINISFLVDLLGDTYELLVANNGNTALEILRSEAAVDLVLLDIQMPKMDGYEVARQIRCDVKLAHLPFIFLTAKHEQEHIVRGFKEGAVDYIIKPFQSEELLVRVKNHLHLATLKNSLSKALGELNIKIAELDSANEALEENKNFLQSILDNTTHAIITTDSEGIITLFNKGAEKMLGYSADEIVHHHTPALFHDVDETHQRTLDFSEELGISIEPGFDTFIIKSRLERPNVHDWIYHTKSGEKIDVRLSISKLIEQDGTITGYLGIAEDITRSKEKALKIQEYITLIDANVIVSSTNLEGRITAVSTAFLEFTGYAKEDVLEQTHRMFKSEDTQKSMIKELWAAILQNEIWKGEIKNRRKDGTFFWTKTTILPNFDRYGEKIGYTAIWQDITDKKTIEAISIIDDLTQLYNRRHFNYIFPKELNRAKRSGRPFCFLMLDIDHFKLYNDTYGHIAGDDVLRQIGEVLNTLAKRAGDYAFRLGGEEFGMILDHADDILMFGEMIRNRIESLQILHEHNLPFKRITASIGIVCMVVDDNSTFEMIYRLADEKLYRAKEEGRNRVVL